MNGLVKWFDEKKGFGFVASSGKDYFVHYKEIQKPGFKNLCEGDQVSFTPVQSVKGPLATKVSMGHQA
jgi:cold shock protein